MVKVKVIKRYNDLCLKKIQEPLVDGKENIFEVSEERAQYLVKQGMVVIVSETDKKAAEKKG